MQASANAEEVALLHEVNAGNLDIWNAQSVSTRLFQRGLLIPNLRHSGRI
jgi:hypothetical protein